MKCENEYCIYNKDYLCILDEINIDSLGMCDSCILLKLEKDFLTNEKEKQLNEIEETWENSNKLDTNL